MTIWTNLERGLNLEEGAVGRIALTRDRDLTHPQQESAHSSWGAKGSHVYGHPLSDGDDLWVLCKEPRCFTNLSSAQISLG